MSELARVELPAVRVNGVTALRQAIVAADAHRQELADAYDIDSLGVGLVQLRQLLGDLRDLTRFVEEDVARLMHSKRYTIDGVGTLERRYGTDRRAWDSEALVKRILSQTLIDPETGEIPYGSIVEAVSNVVAELIACAPFTSSMGWRVTALRERGIDPDEYCETTPGRVSIQVHGEVEQ